MITKPAKLYRDFPANGLQRLAETLTGELARIDPARPVPIIFRADDVGVLSKNFLRLLTLFQNRSMPLCLAVVPAWITRLRWTAMQEHIDTSSPLWCWHQHGWSHANHEQAGKKCEFGPSRTAADVERDLVRGRDRLQRLLGPDFSPFFTPPWNRCTALTTKILKDLGFRGVSRSRGEQRDAEPLPDYYVNVDLHTRKETSSSDSLNRLCSELEQAVNDRYVAIMIHHQRMNDSAFVLLDALLALAAGHQNLIPCGFKEMSYTAT